MVSLCNKWSVQYTKIVLISRKSHLRLFLVIVWVYCHNLSISQPSKTTLVLRKFVRSLRRKLDISVSDLSSCHVWRRVAGVVARSEGDQPSALTPALATIQSHQQRVAHWIFSECFWITTIKQWENSFICGWSPNVLKFAADFCKTNNPIYRLLLWPPSIYLVVLIDTRSCLSVDWLILVPHSCVDYWLTYKKSTPHSGSNLN